MDFSAFCREIYSLISARLPVYLQVETDLRTILHQGGWHYPSSREKNAYFFDCTRAYKHYVSGMELSLIADSMEHAFFCRQWDAVIRMAEPLSKAYSAKQWSLRIRPAEDISFLADSAYYLCWNQYILEACIRQDPALSFRSVLPEDLPEDCHEEVIFWEQFWKKLVRQDPPVLFALKSMNTLQELKLHAPKSWPSQDYASVTYILSSRNIRYGAAVIFYPGLLNRIHKTISDYYLLISSPHEVRIFPGNSSYLRDSLTAKLEEKLPASETQKNTFTTSLYQYTVERGLTSC